MIDILNMLMVACSVLHWSTQVLVTDNSNTYVHVNRHHHTNPRDSDRLQIVVMHVNMNPQPDSGDSDRCIDSSIICSCESQPP